MYFNVLQCAADMYRYYDVPMGRGALITQLKKVVSESTPTPSQKKLIEMAHIRRIAVLVKPCFVYDPSYDSLHDA